MHFATASLLVEKIWSEVESVLSYPYRLLQLIISVLFQFFVMRDLEKLAGWLRIGIIYLGSGIAGSLSSAIFLPYHVEVSGYIYWKFIMIVLLFVLKPNWWTDIHSFAMFFLLQAGPAGCQFGLLACLFVELFQTWDLIQNPLFALGKLSAILVILFIIGLLPMIDNYAHLIGFIFGLLLSFGLLPYVSFGKFDRRRKLVGIVICLFTAMGLFALLVLLFYVIPVYNCPNCHYFNCIPFTEKFCNSMEVSIKRTELYWIKMALVYMNVYCLKRELIDTVVNFKCYLFDIFL